MKIPKITQTDINKFIQTYDEINDLISYRLYFDNIISESINRIISNPTLFTIEGEFKKVKTLMKNVHITQDFNHIIILEISNSEIQYRVDGNDYTIKTDDIIKLGIIMEDDSTLEMYILKKIDLKREIERKKKDKLLKKKLETDKKISDLQKQIDKLNDELNNLK